MVKDLSIQQLPKIVRYNDLISLNHLTPFYKTEEIFAILLSVKSLNSVNKEYVFFYKND